MIREWRARAACLNHNPETWFPKGTRGRTGSKADYRPAREICAGCPVTDECLRFALSGAIDTFHNEGMWGGLDPDQIRAVVKARRNRGKS